MRSQPVEDQFSRWSKYEPFLAGAAVGRLDVSGALESDLCLYADDRIGLFYAPFDYLEAHASIAIVGVTPGPTQAFEAIRCARDGLRAGLDHQDVQASVKHMASFKGMRRDLASWFDAVGLADVLGLGSCDELFSPRARGILHTTSAVRYPTFRRTEGRWQNWNGHQVRALDHPVLRAMVVKVLGPELRALSGAVIVPLGKANESVEYLCRAGHLDPSRCVLGFPHPSPASAHRHRLFAQRERELRRQVARLCADAELPQPEVPDAPVPMPLRAVAGRAVDEITIELSDGNVRHGHFYLRRHLEFFPEDAVGPANSRSGTGTPLRVHFAGDSDAVTTDIAGGNKLMFRSRGAVAAFFRRHGLVGGDAVAVRCVGPREYHVRPVQADR